MASSRKVDVRRITDFGGGARVRARYWTVVVMAVPVALACALALGDIQAVYVLIHVGRQLSETNAELTFREPCVFDRHRGLFDDHAIDARLQVSTMVSSPPLD
jgi:hypothetical protein